MNLQMFSGNLVADPESRTVGNGVVVRFRLAVAERSKEKKTSFLDMEAWDKTGQLILEHFHKGDKLFVRTTLKTESWKNKDGEARSKVVFRVEDLMFEGGNKKEKTEAAQTEGESVDENTTNIPF